MASHSTFHSMRRRGHSDHSTKLHRLTHAHGGHADAVEDKKVVKTEIKKAMGEHDAQLHPGKHTRLKLATGGGAMSKPHLGSPGGKKRSKAGNHVNVNIIHPGGGAAPPIPGAGMVRPPVAPPPRPPMPAPAPAGPMGARPPMMGAPGGMPPGGGMGMPMRAKGGRVAKAAGGLVNAGGKSGEGRLEKAHYEKKRKGGEGENVPAVQNFGHKTKDFHEGEPVTSSRGGRGMKSGGSCG